MLSSLLKSTILFCLLLSSNLLFAQQYETLIKVSKDGKHGYLDENGVERIPCQFDRIENFSEGLALAKKDSNFYYYNTKGEVVLDLGSQYGECGTFSDSVAVVVGKNSLDVHFERGFDLRFIDHSGKEVLRLNEKLRIYEDFPRGLKFHDGLLALGGFAGITYYGGPTYIGYVNKKGELWPPFIFKNYNGMVNWQRFKEGLAGASIYSYRQRRSFTAYGEGGLGYINKKGQWVIPPRYHGINPFHCGVALVYMEKQGLTKRGNLFTKSIDKFYINQKGNRIFADSIEAREDLQKDAVVAVYVDNAKTRYALAKTDGTLLTDFEFEDIRKGELWAVKKDGQYGFINDEGEVVIPYQYSSAYGFSGGVAFVMKGKEEKMIINQKNEIVVAPTYDENLYYKNHNGIISRYQPYGKDETKEYFNNKGEKINLAGYKIEGYGNDGKFQRVLVE